MVDGPGGVLPAVQRVVTGHDSRGRAVFRSDDFSTTHRVPAGDADFLLVWTTAKVPADNNDETEQSTRIVFVLIEAAAYRHAGQPLPEILP